MKAWNGALTAVGIVGGLFVLLGHYVERDSYRCRICSTKKYESQLRLGLWVGPSVPLMPTWERVVETRFFREVLPVNHRHDWMFAQGSPYYLFGTKWGGCAIGGGRHSNQICEMYESSPEFRSFIQSKLQNGSLNNSNLMALMASPEKIDAFLQTYPEK